MNSKEYLSIKQKLPELRARLVESPHGKIPESIAYLASLVFNSESSEDKAALYLLLLSECSRSHIDKVYIHFLRQRLIDFPEDPLSYTGLSSMLAHDLSTQEECLKLAAQAVALSRRKNTFVRYSLTCQARVALQVGNYNVLNEALRGLVRDAGNSRDEDHGFEFDFLDSLDRNRVDRELLSQYEALRDDISSL